MTTRHLYDVPNNDPNVPLCHNLLTGGAVVRQTLANVNCQACLDLQERLPDRTATVTTYRHADHDEVMRELEFFVNVDHPSIISDQTARAIASWYSSPNQNTRNLLALGQGTEFSIEGLREEIEVHMANAEGSDPHVPYTDSELGEALWAWLDQTETIIYG